MGRFIFEKAVVDDTKKDIKKSVVYGFIPEINLICGNNEAGKSSLMSFIKDGLFKAKNLDKGRIYFKLQDDYKTLNLRAEIKDNRSSDKRCCLFNEDTSSAVDYSVLTDTVNQKYFEQGFYITLDDLMNVQNKNTASLIDVIKDPSGEVLVKYLTAVKNEIKKLYGDNKRLTKETSDILEEIKSFDLRIKELSSKESEYNSVISELKSLNDDIYNLTRKKIYINLILKLGQYNSQTAVLNEQYSREYVNYNDLLYNDRENYLSLIEKSALYKANLDKINDLKEKEVSISEKINSDINFLINEYQITVNEDIINSYNPDYSLFKKIKNLSFDLEKFEEELIVLKTKKENLENLLTNLKHEYIPQKDNVISKEKYDDLLKMYSYIESEMIKYNTLLAKTNTTDGTNNKESALYMIIFAAFFLFSLFAGYISYLQNLKPLLYTSVAFCSICAIAFIKILIAFKNNKISNEEKKAKSDIENIILNLKERLKNDYSDIINIENLYFIAKIENIKTDINNKINKFSDVNNLIQKNNNEIKLNTEKLQSINSEITELKNRTNEINSEIQNMIKSQFTKFEIENKDYKEIFEILKRLKDNFSEKNDICRQIDNSQTDNENIKSFVNDFIVKNKTDITVGTDIRDITDKIKTEYERNSNTKHKIDLIMADIKNKQADIANLEEEKKKYPEFISINVDISDTTALKETEEELELKNKIRKEAEYKKKSLEDFEGIGEIRIQRNILLDTYRKQVFKILKNKLVLDIAQRAKNNYSKIQPDLKNAQKYLSILTDGKYTKINLETQEIQNDDGSIRKEWAILSRGTKEQLYFALRLGYASNYTIDKTTLEPNGKMALPLIIDDSFVNFDTERTKKALYCLADFAKTNQILFFTCHSDIMRNYFMQICNEINIPLNVISM